MEGVFQCDSGRISGWILRQNLRDSLPVSGRAEPEETDKEFIKVGRFVKAQGEGNVTYGEILVLQKKTRVLHFQLVDISYYIIPGFRFEQAADIIFAHIDVLRQHRKSDPAVHILLYEPAD